MLVDIPILRHDMKATIPDPHTCQISAVLCFNNCTSDLCLCTQHVFFAIYSIFLIYHPSPCLHITCWNIYWSVQLLAQHEHTSVDISKMTTEPYFNFLNTLHVSHTKYENIYLHRSNLFEMFPMHILVIVACSIMKIKVIFLWKDYTVLLTISNFYSLFTLRKPRSPLILNDEQGFLRVNGL